MKRREGGECSTPVTPRGENAPSTLTDPRGRGTCTLEGSDAPCRSNARCCSGVCIQNDQCASGHCGSRPGVISLTGYCDCEGGGSTCCFPSGRPCQDDEECCSQLCDNMICK